MNIHCSVKSRAAVEFMAARFKELLLRELKAFGCAVLMRVLTLTSLGTAGLDYAEAFLCCVTFFGLFARLMCVTQMAPDICHDMGTFLSLIRPNG